METPSKITDNSLIRIYKFGNCYLDTVERKVFKDEKYLAITFRAFDILQLLVERQGKVVSKDEILEKVWKDSFVEEGNLTVYISKLRKLLGAKKSEPFIETVSGVGYRFVSKVYQVYENDWNKYISNGPDLAKVKTESGLDSIAILPLKNENGDEEIDYLADGLTESLINNLSSTPNLRVVARNSVFRYKDKEFSIQEVGKELGVKTILTGRIRIVRENLIIGVELTNVKDGMQIWGTQLNQPFEDIFEIQDRITQEILVNLKTQISNENKNSPTKDLPQNSESYRLYLKGKYLFNKGTVNSINNAIEYFQQSISHDPISIYSYIELANCYRTLYSYERISHQDAQDQIFPVLESATRINHFSSDLFVAKGSAKMYLEFDLQEAEKNFQRALLLNPNSVHAHYQYSKSLIYRGIFYPALKHIKEMAKIDPISISGNKNIARAFYMMGQYKNAIMRLYESLDLEPNDYQSLLILSANLIELERFDEALTILKRTLKIQSHLEALSMIGYANARAGRKEKATKTLKMIDEESTNKYVPATYQAIIYASLGKKDKAYEYLEKAYEQRYMDIIALKVDPRWKSIKHDQRFNEMLHKIGLPTD